MEANTIFDLSENPIAAFNRGVAWSRTDNCRLGHFDSGLATEGGVYDNVGTKIAEFGEGSVFTRSGQELGTYKSTGKKHELYVQGVKVGACIGSVGAAAAGIVFIFGKQRSDNTAA